MTRFNSDVDIDLADRDAILAHIVHTPAAMYNIAPPRKHATGVYVTDVPYNPIYNMAAIDYHAADERGYFKLDLLNIHLYSRIRDEQHLCTLMREPEWSLLQNREVVEELIHIGNHYDSIIAMPEPITSVMSLAMFLAIIRPGKRHLIGLPWSEVEKTVWQKSEGYTFKKAHAVAYSHLVVVHMNLLVESVLESADKSD